MRKLTYYALFLNEQNKPQWKAQFGTPVILKCAPRVGFYATQDAYREWMVCTAETGTIVSGGDTRKEAVVNAEERVKRHGPSVLKASLTRFRRLARKAGPKPDETPKKGKK